MVKNHGVLWFLMVKPWFSMGFPWFLVVKTMDFRHFSPPKPLRKHSPHHATDGSPGVHHLLSGAARVGGEEVARELVVLELFANLLGVSCGNSYG